MKTFLLFMLTLIFPCVAAADTLQKISSGVYIFEGEISSGSISGFADLKKGSTVYIDSNGGSSAVHSIANFIKDKDIRVVVYGYCLSACMDIFLAAKQKIVLPYAVLGMHGEGLNAGDLYMLEKCKTDTSTKNCSLFEGVKIVSDSRIRLFKEKGINPELFSFFRDRYANIPKIKEFDNCDFVPDSDRLTGFLKKARAYSYNGCILTWGEGKEKDPAFIFPSRKFLEKYGVKGIEYFWYPKNKAQREFVLKKHGFASSDVIFEAE